MWQTDISIDKGYNIEKNIEAYLIEESINYTITTHQNRLIVSIAETDHSKREAFYKVLRKILLVDMKYKYFVRRIGDTMTDERRLLLSEMLFFDSKYENIYIDDILRRQYEYSLDGIMYFKMSELRENWNYLITLFQEVGNRQDDIMTLARYIHDSAIEDEKRIYLTEKNGGIIMFDVKTGESVNNISLLETLDDNILMMLVSAHTSALYVDKKCKFSVSRNLACKLMSVKYV